MVTTDKAAAVGLFARLGLKTLPTSIFDPGESPGAAELTDFGENTPLVLRATGPGEPRNLPRVVGLRPEEAAAWARDLPQHLGVLVQPYDEVVFSAEIGLYGDRYIAELIPEIWELDAGAHPVTIATIGDEMVSMAWPLETQWAKFHSVARGYEHRAARLADCHVASVVDWSRRHRTALRRLYDTYGEAVGVKVHYSARHGLLPQNVRTGLPQLDMENEDQPDEYVVISDLDAPIPHANPVVLDVSVARECFDELATFMDRLKAASVSTVWVVSGVLSHLAIALREAGFTVRRFNGGSLRH